MEVDVSGAIYKNDTEMNSAKVDSRVDGLGNLLFHMHSVHLKPILFAKEETSLQFYEHVGECAAFVVCFINYQRHCTYLLLQLLQPLSASCGASQRKSSLV